MTTATAPTADFFIKRTWVDSTGNVDKVDYLGPYLEHQKFAVAMQRGQDQRRMKPAKVQITRWEWVQGKGA
jgi:hypothetical protein